jgi:amidophosphoribosyltransferase
MTGSGIGFVFRDAHGIRPSYYYVDDEWWLRQVNEQRSGRHFNVGENEVKELMPGQALIVDENGLIEIAQILEPKERKACSFERIYFSRGSDEKFIRKEKHWDIFKRTGTKCN